MLRIPYKFLPVPEDFIDFLLPHLTESELKVLLFILRCTWGFNKPLDKIAMSQFRDGKITKSGKVLCRGTSLTNESIQKAIYILETLSIIVTEKRPGHMSVFIVKYDRNVTHLTAEDFLNARESYSTRDRKYFRMGIFPKNRREGSIKESLDHLKSRKTISPVTKDKSEKIQKIYNVENATTQQIGESNPSLSTKNTEINIDPKILRIESKIIEICQNCNIKWVGKIELLASLLQRVSEEKVLKYTKIAAEARKNKGDRSMGVFFIERAMRSANDESA